jgi:subtilisin family serine protease
LLAAILAVIPVTAPLAAEDSFSMGKRMTVFQRSERWETVTFRKVSAVDGRREIVPPAIAPPLVVPPGSGRAAQLEGPAMYGVLPVQLAPGVSPSGIEPILRHYNHSHAVSGTADGFEAVSSDSPDGNPIYESGGIQKLVVNELIVKFPRGTDPAVIDALFDQFQVTVLKSPADIARDPYLVQLPGKTGHDARVLSNRLDQHSAVEYSQPNFINIDPGRLPAFGLASGPEDCGRCPDDLPTTPGGDPLFASQWHLRNPGDVGKKYADINIEKAWAITQGEPSVAIAVLDDRIDVHHDDFKVRIVKAWDAITEQPMDLDAPLSPDERHGTAAAGLAAASVGNGIGIAGVAGKVDIMPVRTHYTADGPEYVAAQGIKHAADHAQVLSMSWTLGDWNTVLPVIEGALEYASVDKGRVLVFASGNNQGFPAGYPASAASRFPVIAVAATDEWDKLKVIAGPSDPCPWGSSTNPEAIAAPGVHLFTTDRAGEAGYCAAGPLADYATFSGTSAATPVVAGVVALMLSVEPELTPLEVRTRLQQTAEPSSKRIDACRALQGGDECARGLRPDAPSGLGVE